MNSTRLGYFFASAWLLVGLSAFGQVAEKPKPAPPQWTMPPLPQKNPGQVYPPDSLGYLVWTNFIAHTNGAFTRIWSTYELPENFPHDYFTADKLPKETRPQLAWNTNCLMWGMKGETALSQCWTAQGWHGQVPITALTRRHGYTRGHSMGNFGMSDHFSGQRVYFCTTNNEVVEVEVQKCFVQVGKGYDYTLLLFAKDLPAGIETMRVVDLNTVLKKYPPNPATAWIQFQTEQGLNVSAGYPPFMVNTWKMGDSGSPNMLPMPGELVFFSGRSTSGPSEQMQKDMDELSQNAHLDPAKYQMQWFDLSGFPSR